ncbi:MAG: SAM-dependent methyltransferase [Alphaproteobacteria bacterium]|nr:SAM-dependent methyltransferase [Alphaproteobacteria bacterium]
MPVAAAPLKEHIIQKIKAEGPISVAEYMDLALAHPEYGYYRRAHDPLGAGGDFTTAPEISQMFGEVIGAWAADVWLRLGSPPRFTFLECGPGRGTLMADALRATRGVKGFHDAARVTLMEINPHLRALQKQALKQYDPCWIESFDTVTEVQPLVLIANEFLDALPTEQYVRDANAVQGPWRQRRIGYDPTRGLHFIDSGEIREDSPARVDFIRTVAQRLKKTTGAALFIDYGYVQAAAGDTLQALAGHQMVDVLDNPGHADLTTHVDFAALVAAVSNCGAGTSGPLTQGEFLKTLGIEMRAAMLCKNATAQQIVEIHQALHRLVDPAEMGNLFKVLGISHDPAFPAFS